MANTLHSRPGYQCLALVSAGLAIAGAVLPLVPTTPFLLLAAWAANRGSPQIAGWLARHPTFGPMIDGWRERGAVPVRAKWLACLCLVFSWSMLWLGGATYWFLAGLGIFFCLVAGFVVSRPTL